MSEWFDAIIAIIGGLGIGSLITTFIQARKNKKKVLYEQKLLTYTGYLESLANVVSKESTENKQRVVYWTTRLKLLAPKQISEISDEFFRDNGQGTNFIKLRETIVDEMAKDLKKTF